MWAVPPIVALVDTCVACGAELGVGRFCLNCGHRIGAPAPAPAVPAAPPPLPPPLPPSPVSPTPAARPASDPAPAAPPDAAPAAGGRAGPSGPTATPGPTRPGKPLVPSRPADTRPAPTAARSTDPGPGDPDVRPVEPPVQAADPVPVPPTTSPPPVQPRPRPAARATDRGPGRLLGRRTRGDGADPTPSRPGASAPAAAAPSPPRPREEVWDPDEELLPYEVVDDLDEPVVQGRAWIGWVVGATVLVALVLVLLRVVGGGEDTDTSADASVTDTSGTSGSSDTSGSSTGTGAGGEDASEAAAEVPRGVGRLSDLVGGATFAVPDTAEPTTDLDGQLVAYEAAQMGDGDPATTWRTPGDATGQTITITLAQPSVVTRVGLVNGYAKQVAGVDWYPNNRRVLAVTWGFDDGSSIEQTFAERPGMQRLKVPPVQTSTITLTLTSVTPPGTGSLGRDYTAISEVTVIGRLAG